MNHCILKVQFLILKSEDFVLVLHFCSLMNNLYQVERQGKRLKRPNECLRFLNLIIKKSDVSWIVSIENIGSRYTNEYGQIYILSSFIVNNFLTSKILDQFEFD